MTTATSNSVTGITTFLSPTDVVNKEFVDSKLVAQAGNSGEFLTTTDGINVSWDYVSNYQEFTTTGTQTFTVPTNANLLYIEAVGGGGGGSAGITSTISGAGGGSASYTSWYIPKNIISSSNITVTVGEGGSGGSGSGSSGSAGTPTTISWTGPGGTYFMTANPGFSGGVAGSAEGVTTGFDYTTSGLTGGAASASVGNSGISQTNQYQPPSGGSGGNSANGGGTGGGIFYYGNTLTGGSGGTSSGTDGSSGSIVNGLPYGSAGGGGGAQSGSGLVTWSIRTTGTSTAMSSITYRPGGLYLASSSSTLTGPAVWSTRIWPTALLPQGTVRPTTLTYGNGEFICGTTSGLLNSTDSIVWSIRTGISFTALCYGNGYMVGANGTVVYVSTDNIVWTPRNVGNTTSTWVAATYANNRYVLLSWTSGAGRNIVSTDTINWQTGNYSDSGIVPGLVYGDLFVSAGNGVRTSTDGLFWTLRTSSGLPRSQLTYGNGVYLSVNAGDSVSQLSFSFSTNAIVWGRGLFATIEQALQIAGVTTPTSTDEVMAGLGYGNGYFVLHLDANTAGVGQVAKLISTNAIHWILRDTRTKIDVGPFSDENGTDQYHSIVRYGNGIFVTMTGNRSGTFRTIASATEYDLFQYKGIGAALTSSTDSISWTSRTSSSDISSIQSLSSNDSYYYALACDRLNEVGHIIISTDAINWVSRTSGLKNKLTLDVVTASSSAQGNGSTFSMDMNNFAYGNGIYLAGISNNNNGWKLRTNTALAVDDTTVTSTSTPVATYIPDTGQYLMLFQNGGTSTITPPSFVTSTDTIIWTTRTLPIGSSDSASLNYGNNIYLISSSGRIITSTNLVSWRLRTAGFGITNISALTYGDNFFVAVSSVNVHKKSTDGIVWITVTTPPVSGTNGHGYGDGYFVLGSGSDLAVSTDYIVWTLRTCIGVGGSYAYSTPYHVKSGETIISSTDTIVWTVRTLPYSSMNFGETIKNNDDHPVIAAALDGKYIVYNRSSGTVSSRMDLIISTDTIVWTIRTCPAHFENYGSYQCLASSNDKVVYANATFVSSSNNFQNIYSMDIQDLFGEGRGVALASSTDNISWTLRTTASSEVLNSISYGNGKYLLSAATTSNKPVLMVSTDAIVWDVVNQQVISPSNILDGAQRILSTYYANGYYFIAGYLSKIGVSTNAINWTARTVSQFESGNQFVLNPYITSIASYGNSYVIVGSSLNNSIGISNVAVSTDTITWTLRTASSTIKTFSVTNDQQKYVIAGSGILTSEAFWLCGNGGAGARGAGGGGGGSNLIASGSGGKGGDGYAKITWW